MEVVSALKKCIAILKIAETKKKNPEILKQTCAYVIPLIQILVIELFPHISVVTKRPRLRPCFRVQFFNQKDNLKFRKKYLEQNGVIQ